ncbi:MAG: GntR family transcriptional regulator [Litorivicinaceae bacterium]
MTAGLPDSVNESLAEMAARRLRALILTGELQPGERVTEAGLTDLLQISRTPAREAIRILSSEGLLVVFPNRGAEVVSYSPEVVRDSIEVVEYLEGMAGRFAAERATDSEIDEICSLTLEMQAAFRRRDKIRYYTLNQEIHYAILKASHNDVLVEEHQRVNSRLFRIRFQPNDSDARWKSAMDEHEAISTALESRQPELLGELLTNHLSYAWRRSGVYPQLGIGDPE